MDRIAAMNAFVRVVEAGTFTKAADTLDLPNATVTRLIQGLEQHLQVRLLQRTTRAVTVTPEGAIDAMLMMAPLPRATKRGATARVRRVSAVTLSWIILSRNSTSEATSGCVAPTPASSASCRPTSASRCC